MSKHTAKPTRPTMLPTTSRWNDFFKGGNQVFDLITVWMNVFCGLYAYSYWRVIELSKAAPPKEMSAGLVVIVLFYIAGDKLLAKSYLKAISGGYETQPETVAVATGEGATINQGPGEDNPSKLAADANNPNA